jgi:hypothetical protein
MFDAFTKVPTASTFGFTVSALRPTTKNFEDVWSKYSADFRKSVEAVRFRQTDARFIRIVYKNSKDKVGKPFFFIGYGKGNYAFSHPLHPQSGGYDIEANRAVFETLNVEEVLETLKPYVENKFLTDQEKGKNTQKLRRQNKRNSVAAVKNAEAEALLAAAEECLQD